MSSYKFDFKKLITIFVRLISSLTGRMQVFAFGLFCALYTAFVFVCVYLFVFLLFLSLYGAHSFTIQCHQPNKSYKLCVCCLFTTSALCDWLPSSSFQLWLPHKKNLSYGNYHIQQMTLSTKSFITIIIVKLTNVINTASLLFSFTPRAWHHYLVCCCCCWVMAIQYEIFSFNWFYFVVTKSI